MLRLKTMLPQVSVVFRSIVVVCLILAASVVRADTAGQVRRGESATSSGTQVSMAGVEPAVYQRLSTPAMTARTNWARHGGYWGGGWGWGFPGFYNPWVVPQVYGGTWYQRPYPDHLIYNNVRSGAQPAPADCGFGEPDASASGP